MLQVPPQPPLINVLGPFEWRGSSGGRLSPRQRIVVSALVLVGVVEGLTGGDAG